MRATSELSRPSRRSAPSASRRTGGWLLPVLAAAIIFAPPFAPTAEAQTTLVSNVGQTRSGSLGLDTHEGAQAFTTGDNSDGYTVTSVGLDLSSGADHTINFTVAIWTNSNSNLPGSSLVTLTQPASLILGVNEFTTSGIVLAANTTYWVVVDSTGGGSVQWEGTASDSEDSTASGWSIADESYDRPYDGDTWGSWTDPFKFRVNGTAIGSTTNSAPTFTEGTSTTRSVAENTASGQNIGAAVTATDTDTSDTLTYTLGGTDAADFGIVRSSGQLQTSAALNFETKDSYAVTVSVSDGNGGAASINVTINVTDVDEPNFAPVFTEGTSTTRSVAEDTASGQNIGAPVTATDADTSDTLTYTLGGTDASSFTIVSASGQLQTSAALDYETKASYAVTVSVSDSNGGADSINVTINVTADRAALVALYNATGGADWTNNTNWLSNEALSEWHRVETDEDGRVTALRLVANGLSGEIPAELENLTNLQVLSFSINTLSGEIPAELGRLTNLQTLSLSANTLSGEIPAELGNLTNLEGLDLLQNTLSGEIPAELGNLTNLQLLYLDSNKLSGKIPARLGNLTNLLDLYLNRNTLSGEIPAQLGNLANLEFLYLNENMLSGPLPLTLSALSQLSELDIRETTLCAPVDTAFQAWLATINFQGAVCTAPPPPRPSPPPPPPPPPPPASNSPTADAGPDQTGVWEGALVTLDGSGSSDPDDDPLRYRWNQYSGESVVLSSRNVANPTFTAPEGLTADAVLRFRLLVTDPSGRFDSDTVTVTVDPEAEPPPAPPMEDLIYYFPHLAVGAGWQTTITYINYSSEEVSCQTEFLSDQGTPLLVSFADREPAPNRTDVLQPGGSVHQETDVALSAPRVAGWARAACSGPVKASLLYRRFEGGVPTGEAGVNATTVPATRFVTFAEQGEDQFGTGVAYANPSDTTTAFITFTVRDADGEVLASDDLMLSPNGHGAQNMQPLFGLTSFTGSLEVTSTEPIVTLSINAEAAPVFSSLPPGELDAAAQGPQQMTTYYFPHLAVGKSWQTTITYINYSPQPVTCQTDFLSDHDSPLLVSFADRGTVVSRPDVLPPGGSVHQETNVELNAPLAAGWARAACSGPVKASLLYRQFEGGVPTGEAGVNATTVPATRFVTFAEQGEDKPGTGVAYANPSDTAALVTFTARDVDGETVASVDKTLLSNGHDAKNMVGLFDLTSFTGSLEITSTEPIVTLSINAEADPVFSSLPPGELDEFAP